MHSIKILNMDVMTALKMLPDESIDCQITSPPYWGLRDYGIEPSIWDGDENCAHEWKSRTYQIGSVAGNKDRTTPFFTQRNNVNESQKARVPTTQFCLKCGAWKGQLGLEPDFNLFIKHLCAIFDEVKRVLKKDGICWVNLGDTYLGSNQGYGTKKGQGSGIQNAADGYFAASNQTPPAAKFKSMAKCLAMIPERFAIGMIDRGWILRNKIIWHKPNHMPTSIRDRFANSWEYLFMFVKSKKYYFDLDAVREPHKTGHPAKFNIRVRDVKFGRIKNTDRKASEKEIIEYQEHAQIGNYLKGKNPDDIINDRTQELILKLYEIKNRIRGTSNYNGKSRSLTGWNEALSNAKAFRDGLKILQEQEKLSEQELKYLKDYVQNHFGHPLGRNPSDFWDVTTRPFKGAHFAVFPEKLVERPVKVTKKNAIILDIFAGSGTTLKVARDHGRCAVGIEIKPEYVEIIKKRLYNGTKPTPAEFEVLKKETIYG